MKLSVFRERFRKDLREEYPSEEVDSFFNILSEDFLGMNRLKVALAPEKEFKPKEQQKFEAALDRLREHEPIQYITGKTEFFGLPFKVDQNVLIPRPETEELVQWVLDDLRDSDKQNIRILDIGTGSGCVAVALAKELPQGKVSAVDISEEALKIAFLNAQENGVEVDFRQADVLKMQNLGENFDVVISNPPYVRELEKEAMQRNVLEFEPATALYVRDNDPLIFYDRISEISKDALDATGALYFEINQYLGRETEALLQQKNFRTTLKKDIFGVDRMLRARIA